MKMLIGAVALLLAAPAAAQTTPAAGPHAGHAQHQHQQKGQDHSQHEASGGDQKQMDCCKEGTCCEGMKAGEKMACCAKHGEGHGDSQLSKQAHSGHAGH